MKYVAPCLPVAPTCMDALEWGWIDPAGKVIQCIKPKHKAYYSHHDTTGKNGLPLWGSIFQEGYIRYAIGHTGDALFCYTPLDEVKKRVIRFISTHGSVTGRIHLDAGGSQPFNEIEVLDSPAAAIEFLDTYLR